MTLWLADFTPLTADSCVPGEGEGHGSLRSDRRTGQRVVEQLDSTLYRPRC